MDRPQSCNSPGQSCRTADHFDALFANFLSHAARAHCGLCCSICAKCSGDITTHRALIVLTNDSSASLRECIAHGLRGLYGHKHHQLERLTTRQQRSRPKRLKPRAQRKCVCSASDALRKPIVHAALHCIKRRMWREQRNARLRRIKQEALSWVVRCQAFEWVKDGRVVADHCIHAQRECLFHDGGCPVHRHQHAAARRGAIAKQETNVVPTFSKPSGRHSLHGRSKRSHRRRSTRGRAPRSTSPSNRSDRAGAAWC